MQAVRDLHVQIEALREEAAQLYALLRTLPEEQWHQPTTFKSWTPWDVVAHLHMGDHQGLTTLRDPEQFLAFRAQLDATGLSRVDYTREWIGQLDGAALRERWYDTLQTLCESFTSADPDVKLTWAGPGMKPRMFVTARQMETWAHGFEISDLLKAPRQHGDRLHGIATLGVRTYGWTFSNRQMTLPGEAPYVCLTAPSGAAWEWNAPQADNYVKGDAVDFCQVVTQVRNVADVSLEVEGAAATAWMAIAQCFAGPPEDPPAPGSRAA